MIFSGIEKFLFNTKTIIIIGFIVTFLVVKEYSSKEWFNDPVSYEKLNDDCDYCERNDNCSYRLFNERLMF